MLKEIVAEMIRQTESDETMSIYDSAVAVQESGLSRADIESDLRPIPMEQYTAIAERVNTPAMLISIISKVSNKSISECLAIAPRFLALEADQTPTTTMSIELGLTDSEVTAIRIDPHFLTSYKAWSKELDIKIKDYVRTKFKSSAPLAVNVVTKMLRSPDERARYVASKDILDRAGFIASPSEKTSSMHIVGFDENRARRLMSED